MEWRGPCQSVTGHRPEGLSVTSQSSLCRKQVHRFPAPMHAMASISTRIFGVARRRISTSVEQGKLPVKNC